MVTHHLCHLFVNFLRGSDDLLARGITDTDFLRLVRRYDPGAEFEIDFFGGRPKLFIDRSAASGQSYEGQSYVIKRGRGGGRMAAVVAQYKIESYLKGGTFFLPPKVPPSPHPHQHSTNRWVFRRSQKGSKAEKRERERERAKRNKRANSEGAPAQPTKQISPSPS